MTREDKLWSMRMMDLEKVAEKLGIKINKKAAKSKAIEKILAAEAEWENSENIKNEEPIDNPKEVEEVEKTNEASEVNETNKSENSEKTKEVKKPSLKLKELTFKGKTQTIKEWAEEIGMPWPTLYDRVNRNGWPIEEALTTPLGRRRKK